ncbi:DUF488 domain-containing protein [Halomicroarcula sp. GCM10025709]|uniref:DUF488 domain-containing protein n=1 Tax=Haloarcula TaxID=2237 RepID=UPI0024C2EFAC|nr:DUF488 domain-containing protein [Halomicroarcula sp. YJ-61-S]
MTGTVGDTYVAALQHGLADLDGDETLVGVVREPTGWFHATVDENVPDLGPPADLLAETKRVTAEFKRGGMCDEGAHNAAWEETEFAERYRTYLDTEDAPRAALTDLRERLAAEESLVLVCFEGPSKRCHRSILRERLSGEDGE